MRRSDREITDFQEIAAVIEKCEVCRLAMHDEEYPYIVPVNYGMRLEDGRIVLYFHGAMEGKKYELMERDPKVCFEVDCNHGLYTSEEKGNCTMAYESVIGFGMIRQIPDEEKYEALRILMAHYHKEDFTFNQAVMPNTRVWKLEVESCTGKRRVVKQHS